MKRLSKYFIVCMDSIISSMDKKIDDMEYKFSEDFDENSFYNEIDEDDEEDEDVEKELNFDDDADEDVDDDADSDEIDFNDERLEIDEDPLSEDDFDDIDDDIYAHKPILDESIIRDILEARLFAYSTVNNRRISLNKTDWATIAKLSDIGMDRIFLDGKEVFVSGFNKISLKTEKNINIAAESMKSRGLHDYAKRIEQLRC